MNDNQIDAIVKIGATAIQIILDFIEQPPSNDAERIAKDRAALALMVQAKQIGETVAARLCIKNDDSENTRV